MSATAVRRTNSNRRIDPSVATTTGLRRLSPGAEAYDIEAMKSALLTKTTPREKLTLLAVASAPGIDLAGLEKATGMSASALGEALDVLAAYSMVFPVATGDGAVGFAVKKHTATLTSV